MSVSFYLGILSHRLLSVLTIFMMISFIVCLLRALALQILTDVQITSLDDCCV